MKKYSIGIDLGGTKILIGLVEKESGKVVSHIKKKTKKEKGPENIVRKMVEGVEELLEEMENLLRRLVLLVLVLRGKLTGRTEL